MGSTRKDMIQPLYANLTVCPMLCNRMTIFYQQHLPTVTVCSNVYCSHHCYEFVKCKKFNGKSF